MINAASAGMAEPPLQRIKRELQPCEFVRTDWNASPLGVAPLGDYVPDERDRAEFVTSWDAGSIRLDRAAAFIAYGWLEQDGVRFSATAPGSLLLETHCPKCGEPLEPIEVLGLRDGEPTYAPSAMCINESCPSHVPTVAS